MKLRLQNVGKFADASIEIEGITIIGGPNLTGKSTIGKALFAMLNGFCVDDDFYDRTRRQAVQASLREVVLGNNRFFSEAHAQIARMSEMVLAGHKAGGDWTELKAAFQRNCPNLALPALDDLKQKLQSVLNVTDEDLLKARIHRQFSEEFSEQVGRIGCSDGSSMRLQIKDKTLAVDFHRDLEKTRVDQPCLLTNQAVYIDDPFVLNQSRCFPADTPTDHRSHLLDLLTRAPVHNLLEEMVANEKLKNVFTSLDRACKGELVFDQTGQSFLYKEGASSELVNSRNISAGLQTLLILHRLLSNRTIHENDTIILDEPEIHLHPAWQLILAECLVLLQKEYGLHILAASHSPYFIRAVEVYAYKHGLNARLNFYATSSSDEGFKLEDATANPNVIYKALSQPLQDLENVRCAD